MDCYECKCHMTTIRVTIGTGTWWDFVCYCCLEYPETRRRCGPYPTREGWDGGLLAKLL